MQIQWDNNHVLLMVIFWALNWEEILIGTPGNTINFPFSKFNSKTWCRLRFKQTYQWIDYSLEGLMLKLKLQHFGHLVWKSDSLEKTLMLGNIEGRRRSGRQRMRWLDGIINSMDMSLSKLGVGDGQGGLVCCSPWGHKESDMTEWLNWTESMINSWKTGFLLTKSVIFSE